MRKFILIVLLPLTSFGQSTYIKSTVKKLCSEEFHGRGYVNGGDSIAAFYIESQLDSFGLKPMFNSGFKQAFSFKVNTFPSKQVLKINGKSYTPGVDYIIDPGSTSFTGKRKTIFVNHEDLPAIVDGSDKKLKARNLEGKIVIIDSREANENDGKILRKLSMEVCRYAPVVYLNCKKLTWSVGSARYEYPRLEMLCDNLPKKYKSVELEINNVQLKNHQAYNVGGFIDRPNTDKVILFTAHYDHLGRMGSALFPGANDNASGTALVLDIARNLSAKAYELNTDIGFILFAGEEAGLLGSKYFVENSPLVLDSIKFVLNLDIMGTGDEGITVVNAIEQAKAFELLKKINDENQFLKSVKPRKQTSNSDHYWFSENKVPAVFIYTRGGISFYHDVFDKSETLPLDHTDKISELLFNFCTQFAQ